MSLMAFKYGDSLRRVARAEFMAEATRRGYVHRPEPVALPKRETLFPRLEGSLGNALDRICGWLRRADFSAGAQSDTRSFQTGTSAYAAQTSGGDVTK